MVWYISNLFFQCSCLLGWYVNRRILPAKLGLTASMVFLTLLFESVAAYYWLVPDKNNIFLFHFLVPIQYTLLSLTYYYSINLKKIKLIIIGSIALILASEVFFSLTLQPLTVYNTYTQLLSYLLLTVLSAIYLWKALTDEGIIPLEQEPLFWISIGIIFYSVTSFVITGTLNYLIIYSLPWAKTLYAFTNVVAFIMYIIFTFSFFTPRLFKPKVSTTQFYNDDR